MYNKKKINTNSFTPFLTAFYSLSRTLFFFLSTIGNELVVAAQGKYLQDTYRSDILKKMFIGC